MAHWVALPVAVAALGVVAALWTVLIGSADPDGTHSVAQAVVGSTVIAAVVAAGLGITV